MREFWKGFLTGAGIALALVLAVSGFRFFYDRDRKAFEYLEARHELQVMREDIGKRPADGFLEDPGVRRAADNADTEFRRKRDEVLQRFGSRIAD